MVQFLHNRLVKSIIDMECSIQIKSWSVKYVENMVSLISIIDSYWTQGQSETMERPRWFQSGKQNSSSVRNKKTTNKKKDGDTKESSEWHEARRLKNKVKWRVVKWWEQGPNNIEWPRIRYIYIIYIFWRGMQRSHIKGFIRNSWKINKMPQISEEVKNVLIKKLKWENSSITN